MINNPDLILGFVIGLLFLLWLTKDYSKKENFCNKGYCNQNKIEINTENEMQSETETNKKELHKTITNQYPCYKNYHILGYDNPYIYPYNYFWNQNHPISKFNYPQWVSQLNKDDSDNQFPGFTY